MSTKHLYLILLLLMGCHQIVVGQDKAALPAKKGKPTKDELDPQLKIIKDALLKGSVEAANVLLFSENPQAREILLDALKQKENMSARVAVCTALSRARASQKPIQNKEDFIQPLLDILTVGDSDVAKLAAEATLIFKYDQIQPQLEKIATEAALPARLNAIYALKLHPDMRAVIKLIELLGEPESRVSTESEKCLNSLGIEVGKDAESRNQKIQELKRAGQEAFLRNMIIRQEIEMRKLGTELSLWQGRYISALNELYNAISDDAAKCKFLARHLGNSEAVVKLWTLELVSQWWKGPGTKSNLLTELGPVLINLISDQDRNVRLRTARLLSLMGELNSAQRLLEQLKTEQDEEVKLELFVALGAACYYAALPNSGINIQKEIRTQTLEWAVRYLSEQNPTKAQNGAEVLKKLLGQDGLTSAEADKYLALLAEKYKSCKKEDGSLRGELLSAMSSLCVPQSAHSSLSKKRFRPLFEEALGDKTDLVREAAVMGLINIDKMRALERLRKGFTNDPSMVIRQKLIELASEVGGQEDLSWLAEKIGSNAESQPAWQAMLKIFQRGGVEVLKNWVAQFSSQSTQTKFSDEQKISFMEIVERKAATENKTKMLKEAQTELANLYIKKGQFERAAGYLDRLYQAAPAADEKEAILPKLLDAYLRWPKVDSAAKLLEDRLRERDLDPNGAIVQTIDNYLNKPPAGADPNTVVKALLAEIKTAESRPEWQKQRKRWINLISKQVVADEPQKGGK